MDTFGSFDFPIFDYDCKQSASLYEIDDIICNRYRILKKQEGSVGHATIFYCFDQSDRSPCVLKEIPAGNKGEAYRLALLPFHPNVVKLRRLEVVGRSIMMVQDWLPNSLSRYLDRKVSGEQIVEIVGSVCKALDHCIRFLSSEDVIYIHGDIKPDNIFVTSDGTFQLADFGGGYTNKYASPEQNDKKTYDHRTDIYSIGRLIQELCGYCDSIIEQDILLKLAEECVQVDPDLRIQSVQELYRRLYDSDIAPSSTSKLTAAQLRNLALIGEQVNVYQLVECLSEATADELCDMADVFMNMNHLSNAIETYQKARMIEKGAHRPWAGLAKAYAMLSDWDQAIYTSIEALRQNHFDYQIMYTHINALYNKAVQDVSPDFIVTAPDDHIIRKGFLTILHTLEKSHAQFPSHRELFRLMGYIHSILGNNAEMVRCYEQYLATDKDDYEIRFYYAYALYCMYDTSRAIEQFRLVAEYIEKAESRSLGRGIILLTCRYFTNDNDLYKAANQYIKERWNEIPPYARNHYEHLLMKYKIICDCRAHDESDVSAYFDILKIIASKINNGFAVNQKWCQEQLHNISKMRDEWNHLPYADLSIGIRYLNILSYNYESFLYESMGDSEGVLSSCEHMLNYDTSFSKGLYNVATTLVSQNKIIEAIPFYRKAFRYESDPEAKKEIKKEEKQKLFFLYNNPDEFYELLLGKAATWYGSRPVELEAFIQDYSLMFTDKLYDWLHDYAAEMLNKSFYELYTLEGIIPLLNLLEALHDAVVPEFSDEEDPSTIEISMTLSVNALFHVSQPADLSEIALQILNELTEAAANSSIPFFLFNCLRLRGEAYYDRSIGNREDNLEKALESFSSILQMPESCLPESTPHVAWSLHYLGKIYTERTLGKDNLSKADKCLIQAIKIYQSAGNCLNEARVLISKAMLYLKCGFHRDAGALVFKALEYLTLEEDRATFGKAQYITGTCCVQLLRMGDSHELELLRDGIEAFDYVQNIFGRQTQEWCEAREGLIYLYQRKEELYHDGSWAMAKYYQDN